MKNPYPIHMNLLGKKVVVVGGGVVAEKRIIGLLDTCAQLEIISPELTEKLQNIVEATTFISWKRKLFTADDIVDAHLIIAATNQRETNLLVKHSTKPHQLVNIVDDPEEGDFVIPSVIKRGLLTLSISTGGASPTLSAQIRRHLEETYDEKYEQYLEFLHETRGFILKNVKNPAKKRLLLTSIVNQNFLDSHTREEDFMVLYKNIMLT
jgi:precorrin-2 dehydrogenase / sirohydrochlorin ferrochelatase